MTSFLHKFGINRLDMKYKFLVLADPSKLKTGLSQLLEGPYKGRLCEDFIWHIPLLEKGELAETVVHTLYKFACRLTAGGEFNSLVYFSLMSKLQSSDIRRCYGFHSQKRWKLQLFYMPKGTEHPPHAHHNLDSFLIVLSGKIWVKEFRREIS